MGDILSRLGQLFVQSTPTVVFVFLLLVILDRFFFRRLTGVLREREAGTLGALARAREQAAAAEAKAREYKAAFQAARQEVYRLREAERQEALSERESTLKKVGEQTESWLKESQAALAAEVAAAKRELEKACQTLAVEIADAILGTGRPADREARFPD